MLYNNWFMLSNFVSGSLCKCFSEIHPTLNERFFLHQKQKGELIEISCFDKWQMLKTSSVVIDIWTLSTSSASYLYVARSFTCPLTHILVSLGYFVPLVIECPIREALGLLVSP